MAGYGRGVADGDAGAWVSPVWRGALPMFASQSDRCEWERPCAAPVRRRPPTISISIEPAALGPVRRSRIAGGLPGLSSARRRWRGAGSCGKLTKRWPAPISAACRARRGSPGPAPADAGQRPGWPRGDRSSGPPSLRLCRRPAPKLAGCDRRSVGPAPMAGDDPDAGAAIRRPVRATGRHLGRRPRPAAPEGPALHELPSRRGTDDAGPDPGSRPGAAAGPVPAGRCRPHRPDARPAARTASRSGARRRDRRWPGAGRCV